jgi:hypothetical protein
MTTKCLPEELRAANAWCFVAPAADRNEDRNR